MALHVSPLGFMDIVGKAFLLLGCVWTLGWICLLARSAHAIMTIFMMFSG